MNETANEDKPIDVEKLTIGGFLNAIKRMKLSSFCVLILMLVSITGAAFSFGIAFEDLRDLLIPPKWASEDFTWSAAGKVETEDYLNKLGLHPDHIRGDFSYIDKGGKSRITIWNRIDKPNEGWNWYMKDKSSVNEFRTLMDRELGNGNIIPMGITNNNVGGFYLLATKSK